MFYFLNLINVVTLTSNSLNNCPLELIFEKNFSKYVGVKYCISTNNGTDALILCLKAIGIKKGDEIITVCNSFYATAGAIVEVGAKPIFVDVNDNDWLINTKKIEKVITKKTKAIMPVHLHGLMCDMKEINIINVWKIYQN
jgi:dTDP-4-amino-4,6-dideoxygalactose transaminase